MMNIKPRAAGGYVALLLVVIAVMAGYIVSSPAMPDVCLVDPWQLIAFELLLYVTLCYLWDRRTGAIETFLKVLGMIAARLGLAALTFAIGVLRGEILSENVRMQDLARKLGFELKTGPGVVEMRLPLHPPAPQKAAA